MKVNKLYDLREIFTHRNIQAPQTLSMVKVPLTKVESSVKPSNRRHVKQKLDAYVERMSKPQIIDYRTPLYSVPNKSASRVLANTRVTGKDGVKAIPRESIITSLYHDLKKVLPPVYLKFEEQFLDYAISSRSRRVGFNDLREDIEKYFTAQPREIKHADVWLEALNRGAARLDKLIPDKSLDILSPEAAMDRLPATTMGGMEEGITGKEVRLNKETGKEEVVADNRHFYLKRAKEIINGKIPNEGASASISIGRGQEARKEKLIKDFFNKQREPGAEDHAGTIIGAMMGKFLDVRTNQSGRAALRSQSDVDRRLYNASLTLNQNQGLYSFDGGGYDGHMYAQIALTMSEVIVAKFKGPESYIRAIREYWKNVFFSSLITAGGAYRGLHGMPSGTGWVNPLDSEYNDLLTDFVNVYCERNRIDIKLEALEAQGDDKVEIVTTSLTDETMIKETIANVYKEGGQDVNSDKTDLSKTTCTFLKRLHVKGVVESYRSYCGTAIGASNMEYPKDGKPAMHTARGIMQAANHYETLPGFDTFMKFMVNGDVDYRMGLSLRDPADIFKIAGGATKVIARLGLEQYATHLGVTHKNGVSISSDNKARAKLEVSNLSSINWLRKHK